jgi:hypothetical protein
LFKLRRESDDIHRYDFLSQLQDRNETLFYRLLIDNIEEFGVLDFFAVMLAFGEVF